MNDTLASAPDIAAGAPPLLRRLGAAPGSHWVAAANLDTFLARGGEQVLFFQGDPVRFPEVLDVAVVLPELRRHFGARFEIGLVARADEDRLASRFAVVHWPSLVFLRDGRWVETVHGMLDWDVYVQRLQAVFAKPATRPPILLRPAPAAGGCR
ncbi:MAG: hydrogenase [Proteobacteria bacterium]|nr:hydrogenase [Pseudomonadota bacterium]